MQTLYKFLRHEPRRGKLTDLHYMENVDNLAHKDRKQYLLAIFFV